MIVFGPLWFVIAVVAIYFVVRIARAPARRSPGPFDPTHFNTARLPRRTYAELKGQTEWVTYNGRTPSLRLRVRGNSYEGFRRVVRKHIDRVGQDYFEQLSAAERMQFLLQAIAEAYVIEWEGAEYPNGGPMPFSPANLALFMAGDQHLTAFVNQEADRLSPPWPTR
jgi:hypothetical protein